MFLHVRQVSRQASKYKYAIPHRTGFMKLPASVRHRIYSYVPCPDELQELHFSTDGRHPISLTAQYPPEHPAPRYSRFPLISLMSTCRALRKEHSNPIYDQTIFTCTIWQIAVWDTASSIRLWLENRQAFFRYHPPPAFIRHLQIDLTFTTHQTMDMAHFTQLLEPVFWMVREGALQNLTFVMHRNTGAVRKRQVIDTIRESWTIPLFEKTYERSSKDNTKVWIYNIQYVDNPGRRMKRRQKYERSGFWDERDRIEILEEIEWLETLEDVDGIAELEASTRARQPPARYQPSNSIYIECTQTPNNTSRTHRIKDFAGRL